MLRIKTTKGFITFNEFNSICSDVDNTPEYIINSNYYDINYLKTLKESTDKSSHSLFYLNTCSLSKNIDDGMPQDFKLEPLLFLIYIKYLHVAISSSEVHLFVDDTNILNFNNCARPSNKSIMT